MDYEYINLLRDSFEEFLRYLDEPLEPDDPYLPYDFPYITAARWNFMANALLQDELREVTNRLHEWRDMLRRWHAWNRVVSLKEETPAWDLRREFMEPLMHTCLMMPSAMRDIFTFVGTNALHQVRLHLEPGYTDRLEGDPSAAVPTPRSLTRRQKETRLVQVARPLENTSDFIHAIRQLDSEDYRTKTSDYRNLNSHAIGPRIALGQTRMVTRRVVPATRMEPQEDGTGRIVEVPDRYVASYAIGGLQPLDIDTARTANVEQYTVARACFDFFTGILKSHADRLPRTDA